jgi:hypothetical protein
MPKLPLSSTRREDRIAQRLLAITWQFPSLFYEAKRICLQSQELWKILQTLSGSSVFELSNHTTFSQTQTGATPPLNGNKNNYTIKPIVVLVTAHFTEKTQQRGF